MQQQNAHKKRNVWLAVLSSIFLLAGIIWLLYWIFIGRFYVYTQDAYVNGNEIELTPQVTAGVTAIYADDTDLVREGQLVVALDPSDYQIRVEELREKLAASVRDVSALFQDAEAKKAQIALRRAQYQLALLDFRNREPLVKTGAVSEEEFATYETNVEVSKANIIFAEKEYQAAQALVEGTTIETHPRVEEAIWLLKQAYLNLIRCQIWAPVTGYIAKRSVQVGDQVAMGAPLLFIVPLDEIWIEANYKETQLKHVRIDQPVSFTADLYGRDLKFHGVVEGFQPGSGSAFALLPPQNASGNWIKIIQRVPVRIKLDPEEIEKCPLLLGLSMRVTVDIHDRSGHLLASIPKEKKLYHTSVYEKQEQELTQFNREIAAIIETNKWTNP